MPFSRAIIAAAFALALFPVLAFTQVPPRFYWKSLSGGNAVPVISMSMSGNANPIDPAHTVLPESNVEATIALVGYARTFSLSDRAAFVAILAPMGRISGEVSVGGRTVDQEASGFGDPTLEVGVNVLGPKALKSVPDVLRYEPGFSLDLVGDLAFPIGEYQNDQALNLGQNRWYGRIGAPIVWQLGPWVPGRRTTLEFLPSVWFFGNNGDYMGHSLSTDPIFQMEGHWTRDFAEHLWGSLDAAWFTGGKSSVDGLEGENLNHVGVGFTLGYHINDNLQLTAGYMATTNDSDPGDLRMDGFKVSLVFGWHPIIEGMKRLQGGESPR